MSERFDEIIQRVKASELAAAEKRSESIDLSETAPLKRGMFGKMFDSGQLPYPRAVLLNARRGER